MAAPAQRKEFEGNVVAVLTESIGTSSYLMRRKRRMRSWQAAKKIAAERNLKPEDQRSLTEQMRNEGMTERERLIVEKGISNFEFHYLGSAKILGRIGKGLAESMAELKHLKKQGD